MEVGIVDRLRRLIRGISTDPRPSWPLRGFSRATLVVILVGVALRLVQLLGNPSLWLDELWLAQNILTRAPVELLTRGLDHGQVAPAGFLALEKASVLLFGGGELALRVVPFVASLAALVVFAVAARDLLAPPGAFVAIACFALNPLLISLSTVVKQYSTDVLATVLLLVAMGRLWDDRGSYRSRILLGASAGALGFFSIGSAMITMAALAALALRAWRSGSLRLPGQRAQVLLPLFCWGAIAATAGLAAQALLTPPMREYMRSDWAPAFAPSFFAYPTWVFEHLRSQLLPAWFLRPYFGSASALEPALALLASAPVVLGITALAALTFTRRRGLEFALALLVPFVAALGLSRLQIYPIEGRASALLLPLVMLVIGGAVPARVRSVRLAMPVATAALLAVVLIDDHPVYRVERTRELIQELAERRDPDQPVWAYPWAWPALRYYGPRFGITEGIHVDTDLVFRVDLHPDSELPDLLAGLDGLRGEPTLWVLFTAHPPAHRDLILCYLDEIGLETERVVLADAATPVSLHGYDLSQPERWINARATTFPLVPEAFQEPNARCLRRPLGT